MEFLRRIECPVLIVQGKESRQSARPDREKRLAAITRRVVVEIEEAGHMIHHDNPESLADAVIGFLDH